MSTSDIDAAALWPISMPLLPYTCNTSVLEKYKKAASRGHEIPLFPR